ncbi:MAG: HigA family addiction module antitoxin [Pseudomonadota bacterium]
MNRLRITRHSGYTLKTEYLDPLEMSAGKLAKELGLRRERIERLVKGTTPITADTALRLGRYFGTTPQFWMNLQIDYDLVSTAGKIDLSGIKPMDAG